MSVKNSFVSLANQIEILANNSLSMTASLNEVVSSTNSEVVVNQTDSKGNVNKISLPSVGSLKSDISIINQNIKTLSSLDQRGSIIRIDENTGKRIIAYDINREPNTISDISNISTFISERNSMFEALLNPALSIEIDLTKKIEDNVRKVQVKKYIIEFLVDEFGNTTEQADSAIISYNTLLKNRTNITESELENWILNTPGIKADNRGNKLNISESFVDLEPNKLKYEGFFTILEVEDDSVNRKRYYKVDTLDYYEIATKKVSQLQINDELIINTPISTTRYKIVEVSKQSSEFKLRLESIEGFEPMPVGVLRGLKFYSPIIKVKKAQIQVGFDEFSVIFLKAYNTENFILSRNYSNGMAIYSNDLTLLSDSNSGDNGKSMQQFYIETVKDFGEYLNDSVLRFIPRNRGVVPNSVVLTAENFRTVQSNKFLTETASLEDNRKKNQQITDLRSKIDETNKIIQEKQRELFGRTFKNPKDRSDIENQIKKLTDQSSADTSLLNTTVQELIASTQNNTTVDPTYEIQGFWQMPSPVENGKTRPQEVIQFYIEYKYSNIDGKEAENNTFKVVEQDGTLVNAVFSPWKSYLSPIRKRVYDITKQDYIWQDQKLESIDDTNINSLSLPLCPNERITIRVKSISEVGYPESVIESAWSNELTITFPIALLQPRNQQEIFKKNADLEDLRGRVVSDFDRKGLSQHLFDALTIESKYYAHVSDNIGIFDSSGKLISLSQRIKQIESASPVDKQIDIVLSQYWTTYGNGYGSAKYYLHEGRVYLSGMIKVDKGSSFKSIDERFPILDISLASSLNTNFSSIGLLPEGYRPETVVANATVCYAGASTSTSSIVYDSKVARINITPDGNIICSQGNTGWISLDNISFRVV